MTAQKGKILLLSPTSRERTQLPAIAEKLCCELIFDDFDEDYFDEFLGESPDSSIATLDMVALIENTVAKYKDVGLTGVTSAVGYPGMSAASIIARTLGLPGAPPEAIMLCEHKYYSRLFQEKFVPEATPPFALIDPASAELNDEIGFPSFLKPVKSCMSKNAFTVHSQEELEKLVQTSVLPHQFVEPFDQMVRRYTDFTQHAACLLHEGLLSGVQVSLEGYVYKGAVHVMGVVDAVMFAGTRSFKRWQYPSSLPEGVLARMTDIAERFFAGIKYDNALFNMELFYDSDSDRIGIIEINPKIASQFPNLFEKVDGFSTYTTLLEVAAGLAPVVHKRQGEYKIAASCVMRLFSDQMVRAVPDQKQIDEVLALYPGSRVQIYATPGKRLSEQAQDAFSFRYGLIDLGAQSEAELEQKFEKCMSILDFKFEPV
jgi:biotin carboxylase